MEKSKGGRPSIGDDKKTKHPVFLTAKTRRAVQRIADKNKKPFGAILGEMVRWGLKAYKNRDLLDPKAEAPETVPQKIEKAPKTKPKTDEYGLPQDFNE